MPENRTWDDSPTVEVRIYRGGQLVHTELCESDAEAADVADRWGEDASVTVEVDDLTIRHRPGDVLEPDPPVVGDFDYPEGP